MTKRGPVLVIDIGGTKMAAGVAEAGGRLITWSQVPTPRDVDGEKLWLTLESLLLQVTMTRSRWRPANTGAARAAAAGTCSAWWSRPASVAGSFSTTT
jgi:hypothetical protein